MIPEQNGTDDSPFKQYEGYKAFAIDTIILDEPLEFDLYIDNAGRLVKYVKSGDMLQGAKKEKLLQNCVDHFYITTLDSKAFDDYLTSHLGAVLNNPGLDKTQKSKILYTSSIHVMHELFDSDVSESKILAAKELMCETVKRIVSNEVTAASILQISSHDYKSYSHSVNVALYSIGIAHEYGIEGRDLERIASGAILHDVGKCRIDRCVINKPAKLSMEEFETIKEHPEYGYQSLMENGETDPVILDIVRNHHEKLDGSGYSRGLSADEISFATQIVTVADIFDALSTNRAYKEAASFFVALKTMKVQMKDQLNMDLVDSLIRMMGKV
ncbi:MAG: HD domain-containing protein [Sulfurimonadaceae bacterium]|nr:HD domain-containing protein [Sulfurimonadaceae bacterium]